ncbi:hypothetical protein [Streptomyces smaragdinus]|uniref:hypothetical protein n=1 Tax=Streptomyces smaragdinus TaxID=2585196 RepID=UPI001886814E|nr:hypothetical protein [Streptomyces smaragdinus]
MLVVPAAAGFAVLGRRLRTGPVALTGRLMRFLVAPGAAAEVPGLLRWLEWGDLPLGLDARRAGPGEFAGAVWLRPPAPDLLRRLPAPALDARAQTPDLGRIVGAAATACHRLLLFGALGGEAPRGIREMPRGRTLAFGRVSDPGRQESAPLPG